MTGVENAGMVLVGLCSSIVWGVCTQPFWDGIYEPWVFMPQFGFGLDCVGYIIFFQVICRALKDLDCELTV
jgi:hypothetical protein